MLATINLKQILFLDIETVPEKQDFEKLNSKSKDLWEKKSKYFRTNGQTASDVYQRAGIFAEFGKIVCISVGILKGDDNSYGIRLKSFSSEDESSLLNNFIRLVSKLEAKKPVILCAHNGKEFDFPYIARRLLINGIQLPECLDVAGKKPWEIHHIDTLELWKFGDYKHYTSLDLLTHIFNIPSPKVEIDGSMVADVYYEEKDLSKIVKYCENDVVAIIQLLLRYMNRPLVEDSLVEPTV